MKQIRYSVTGKLFCFEEYTASWTYVIIPINKIPDVDPGGWGAIPVEVTLGESLWHTSMFPLGHGKKEYFLPIKKPILKKENLKLGDTVTVNYFTTRSNL